MSTRLSDIEEGIELALKDIEHAKIEVADLDALEGDRPLLLERLWDELDDLEDRIKAVRDDEEFQKALDIEEKYRGDMVVQADSSW
jgi:hypothetical protein